MKRKGNFYPEIYNFSNLYLSFLQVRKGKRYKKEILEFYFNLEENLFDIQKNLKNETYKHGDYKTFIVRDSKKREIKAPRVRDRVVHHALCNLINPFFDNTFYNYSYACRKGKGNHMAVADVKRKLNKKDDFYCFQSDISKYFDSVNHCFLYKIIEKKIKDVKVLKLIREIIESNEKGIPIGNLTSQLFANIYLNELDQFIKRKLNIKYYFRYMDDFLIFSIDKKYLREIKEKVQIFLKEKLKLEYKEKATRIFPISLGIDFLGYIIFKEYIVLRKKTVLRLVKKLKGKDFSIAFYTWKAYSKKSKSYNLTQKIFNKLFC
ncbi:MAG: reverse transcriptase/maturase family protein [Candidatus Pacebacteria bacterium]|nr:reverse transcriptase/maturase family protein [Bacteroidales bacterium]MDD3919375.1 reverse transcriptase/maturase family protein [Candidatus Paceibacterota bacterium]